jgi:uncharacterized protein YukE
MAGFNKVHADTDAISVFAQQSQERVNEIRALMSSLESNITKVVEGPWQGPTSQATRGAGQRAVQSLQAAQTATESTNVTSITQFNNAQIALEESSSSDMGRMLL